MLFLLLNLNSLISLHFPTLFLIPLGKEAHGSLYFQGELDVIVSKQSRSNQGAGCIF
ncbi:hypothetical protein AAZX31_11G010200 [Glycine max]